MSDKKDDLGLMRWDRFVAGTIFGLCFGALLVFLSRYLPRPAKDTAVLASETDADFWSGGRYPALVTDGSSRAALYREAEIKRSQKKPDGTAYRETLADCTYGDRSLDEAVGQLRRYGYEPADAEVLLNYVAESTTFHEGRIVYAAGTQFPYDGLQKSTFVTCTIDSVRPDGRRYRLLTECWAEHKSESRMLVAEDCVLGVRPAKVP